MERGNILGAVARSIFPEGSLVGTNDRSSTVSKTKSLLKTNSGPIYESAFTYDGILKVTLSTPTLNVAVHPNNNCHLYYYINSL